MSLSKSVSETTALLQTVIKDIGSVRESQAVMATSLTNLAEATKGLKKEVDDVRDRQATHGRTQWSVLIAAAALLFAAIQYFGDSYSKGSESRIAGVETAVIQKFDRVNSDISALTKELRDHDGYKGHPDSVLEKMDALDEKIKGNLKKQEKTTDRLYHEIDSMRERMREYDKRTGILFKDGKAY